MDPVLPELRHPLLLVPVLRPGTLRLIRRLPVPPGPVVPGIDVEQRTVPAGEDHPAVTVFVYDGPDRPRPSGALLWIHGGGYVLGHPATYHEKAVQPVRWRPGHVVVSVDYRLAPEHPFPAGLGGLLRRAGMGGMTTRTSWASTNPGSPSAGTAPAEVWPLPWPSSLPDRGEVAGVLPAVGLPDARRPDRPAPPITGGTGCVRVDPDKQRIRLEFLSRAPGPRRSDEDTGRTRRPRGGRT